MAVKNPMTSDFLHSAYGGESLAHMRYLTWAKMAEKEGFKNIARLFEAIAYAELVHANNHFREIGGETTFKEQSMVSFMKLSRCIQYI